jgi:hypothetical protein
MTIAISGGLLTEPVTISGSSRTTVFTALRRTLIASIVVTPTSGTPNLSVSRYDGTTRSYLRRTVAMTAGTAFIWNEPFTVDPGGLIEVESSAAGGDMDVLTTYVNPVAPATVRTST